MRIRGLIAGLVATSIWGGMYVTTKVVLEVIPPFGLLWLRLLLGIMTLWLVLTRRGGVRFTPQQWRQVMGVGFIGYGISIAFQFVGTKLSTASNAALVTSTTPAFAFLFALWILKERVTPRRFAALCLSTLGVVAVIDPRSTRLSPELFWGNLSLIMAALTWALYSVFIRKVTRDLDTLSVSMAAFFGGLPLALPAAGWEYVATGWGDITVGVVLGVLYVGVVSTALAMYLWNLAFTYLEAGVASLTFFAQPVVGAALGTIFLGEELTPLFLLGGVLIALGILFVAQEKE
ncbi:MAG: DMT family transporter [Chloroflexota bacterium]